MATKKSNTPVIPAPPYGRPLTKEEWNFVKQNIKNHQKINQSQKGKNGQKKS